MTNTQHNPEAFDATIDDEEVIAGLRRSVAGATLTTSIADVTALGRRTRNRHRAIAAGIGTSAAALVAAVGVLAPSAGTPAGSADAGSATVLKIQDAGFTLEEHGDGTVLLTFLQAMDPKKLQAAMDKAGISADIQRVPIPDDWDQNRGIECQGDRAKFDAAPHDAITWAKPHDLHNLVIHKDKIPAGDFIALRSFEKDGHQVFINFGAEAGPVVPCVPYLVVPASAPARP